MARLKIRTPAELRRISRAQVSEEVRGELAPYQTQKRQTTARRSRALSDLGELYGGIRNAATESARRVAGLYGQSYDTQRQLFDQAATRLDQFRQQRAADAQALAQQVGGPVPMSAFTEGVDPGSVMPHMAAGGLLNALALGQAGVQEAEGFAGKVFPLIQAEETQRTSRDYDEQIDSIEDEIARIKASAAGRRTTKYNELLVQERQDQLERLRADRDWILGKGSLDVSKGGLRLQGQELQERKRAARAGESLARQELIADAMDAGQDVLDTKEDEARQLVDILTTGTAGETMNLTEFQSVGDFEPEDAPEGAILLPGGRSNIAGSKKKRYYKPVNVRSQVGATAPLTDPNQVFFELTRRGYDRTMSANIVRQFFALGPKWKPRSGLTNRNKKPPPPKKPKKLKRPKGTRGGP